jgi:hypothetical protein
MYHSVGRWDATLPFIRSYASRIKAIRENFLSLERLWHTHPLATMASAKLSYLVSPALIVSVGLSGTPLRRFLFCSLMVSTIYLAVRAHVCGRSIRLTLQYDPISTALGILVPLAVCTTSALEEAVRPGKAIAQCRQLISRKTNSPSPAMRRDRSSGESINLVPLAARDRAAHLAAGTASDKIIIAPLWY